MTYTPAEKRESIKWVMLLLEDVRDGEFTPENDDEAQCSDALKIFEAIAADYAERDMFAPCPICTPRMED